MLVAIDAGHGSNTAGKRTPDGYKEHWINVKSASYFNKAMKRCGVNTVKIAWNDDNAKDDTDVDLVVRQKTIRASKADISVSFHANAYASTWNSAEGIETLIHDNPSKAKDSLKLANLVQAELIKGTKQNNRGVKKMELALCNCIAMGTKASILIEIGFMTNKYEADLMKTDAFCKECAEETARGVCKYLGLKYIEEGEEEMTQEKFNQMMDAYLAERNKKEGSVSSEDARAWATENGIFIGDDSKRYAWQGFVTREQIAIVLYRLYRLIRG